MLAKFMSDTPLAAIEIEMQLIPGFSPRSRGVYQSQKNYLVPMPVQYEELLSLFIKEVEAQSFALRIEKIMREKEVNQKFFRTEDHKKRFHSIYKSGLFPNIEQSNGYAAAIFLLTADEFVWGKAKNYVESHHIYFKNILIHGVDLDGYIVFHMAKDLYFARPHITISELSDSELINDKVLHLIINAFLVRRYGITVLSLE